MTEPLSAGAPTIGVLIIGDEILSGRRTDQHLAAVISKLAPRGRLPGWVQIIGDDAPRIERVLRESRALGDIVFCFGGIGATPDDLTRAAAAEAFDQPLQRHPEAVQLIETEFGAQAHPNRILMADLPYGAGLIPNPVNRVPGFYLDQHYFMPGFPTMAHPMLDWILTGPLAALDQHDYREQSLWVLDTSESTLIGLMNELCQNYPDLKLFSLPTRLGVRPVIEMGFKGAVLRVAEAMSLLSARLDALGIRHQLGRPDAES